ncbi:MAG: copper resistance CopC family protein [Brevibacterium yomogidense]
MTLRSRTLTAVIAALLMMFGLTLGQAAHAHDQLVGSNPEEGAELDEQPEWLELDFSGEIQDVGTEIQVLQDGDQDISAGEVTVEGTSVSSALPDNMTPGEYTVQWRVVSSDGHPISGEFDFTLTDAVGAGEEGGADEGAAEGEGGDGPAELGGAAVDQPEDGAQDQGALSEDADSGGMSTPMMILLVVGGLAVVVLVILLLTRKQKGLPGTPGNPENPETPEKPDTK